MKKLGIIILATFLLSIPVIKYINNSKEPNYCKYANNITRAFKASVHKKYGLVATMGGGSFMDNVKMISLSFDTLDKEYNIDQTRELMINCIEDYLKRINEDEKIKPYLSHFPFTVKGVEFQIAFYEKSHQRVSEKYVCLVGIVNEKIYYCTYDHAKKTLVDVYEEPYQEALKKVKDAGLLSYEKDGEVDEKVMGGVEFGIK